MKTFPSHQGSGAEAKNPADPNVVDASAEEVFVFPLSFAQQRLWFIDQFEPGSSLYNIPVVVKLTGRLDLVALKRALNGVIERHEVLRTTFAVIDEEPMQVIHPSMRVALPVVDLGELPGAEREVEAQRLVREEAWRPFVLSKGPLLRVGLWALGAEEYLLSLTMHHIVSDGWSRAVLVREIAALYKAHLEGQPSPLPELPIQYADYAVWQREWLQGPALDEQLRYWREQLAGAPPVLELPTDRPRRDTPSRRGAFEPIALSAALTEKLKTLSQQQGCTLFMTLLAAWQTLLFRYSHQSDIVVGGVVANRNRGETEALIGFFVNMLVLRTDFSGDPTFIELLGRVREVCLGAYAHQDMPFERLVEELRPERRLGLQPLFQVVFILQNTPQERLALPGLELSGLGVEAEAAKYDLILSLHEGEGGLAGTLSHDAELFEAATIRRMLGHLRTLLEGAAADARRPVSALPLLTEAEERRLLVECNRTAAPFPRRCFDELFSEQAARTPAAVAVSCRGERVTYAELEARSNQLAHRLRALGVGPEVCVGVMVERSVAMVVALLGVLKAGGAYVPLDPAYPRERLEFMLEDSGARVLLSQRGLADALAARGARLLCLDADRGEVGREPRTRPASGARPENLAYVIYTSGSTGRPKGVAITHRSAVAFSQWARDSFAPGAFAATLACTSICFDLSVFELFVPLHCGGRVVLVEGPWHAAADEEARGVTLLNTVPSAAAELARLGHVPPAAGVINLAGEPLPRRLARQLYELPQVREVFNLYGPTEDTTYSTWELVGREGEGAPAIGRPVDNTRAYVLDRRGRPVPEGVAGELYLGGEGLARGYLGRPALTAERFVPDPHSGEAGARLYRTGDLARRLADGSLEFLGRVDHQVKVRGFRVEPGEVEAALLMHPAVRECAVVAREDAPGDRRLVAYVVVEGGAGAAAELRGFLGGKLPGHLIPSAIVALERLPLTPNGKLDRGALPAPGAGGAGGSGGSVAPRTPVEEMVAEVWGEVLGVGRVGAGENFFELGGHSLLATQAVSRLRGAFGWEVPLRSLFEHPTVEGLARYIEAGLRGGVEVAQAPPLTRAERKELMPLSFVQQRLWFLDQFEPGRSTYNMTGSVRLTGHLDVNALARAFDAIRRRHETLRTRFVAVDGQPWQVIDPFVRRPLPQVELSELAEAEREREVQRLVREEARRPFDLAEGPLLRVSLVRVGATEHALLLTMHHIVSDGWSVDILVREAAALYAAYREGRPSPLKELAVQYADYAVWQRGWLQGAVLEEQLQYWAAQLSGAPPVLQLPLDNPRPAAQSFRGAAAAAAVDAEVVEGLRQLSRAQGVTLYMTLLAAFDVLLARYTGESDIVVGTPIANRNRAETEPLIGFFINTLALRTDLSGDPTFVELLRRVREVTLGAYARQDLPFEKLLEELKPERSLSHTPLFQVFFNMLNLPQSVVELPGLTMQALVPHEVGANFDLTLYLAEREGGALGLSLVYNAELFQQRRMDEMLEQYKGLLRQIVADPSARLARFSLVTPAAAALLPDPARPLRDDYEGAVQTVFSRQARRAPDRPAVSDGGETWSYRELDEWSNRLANYLRERGVGPQDVVAIYGRRSAALVWGLLGVLKAGAAFVVLDPAYPASRLIDCLKVARPRGWLAVEAAGAPDPEVKKFVDGLACRLTLPRRAAAERGPLAEQSAEDPRVSVGADDLAYVAFTSGSTGKPKGIAGRHGSLTHFTPWLKETFGLAEHDRFSMLSGLSHDPLHRDIFTPLQLGATICVPDPDEVVAGGRLAAWMNEEQVTVANLTPAMGQLLTETAGGADARVPSLRRAFLVGDALTRRDVANLRRLAPSVTCVNFYGTTETQQALGYYVIPPEAGGRAESAADGAKEVFPVGRGIKDVQLLVLNDCGQLAGVGEGGEIYVRSPHVALGYVGDEAATRARFIVNPFTRADGDWLYRTGDLGRYLPDGNVELTGRADTQIKIRGFRVEPAEIEAVVGEHPAVREAVVVAREDAPGDKRLVAYVVAEAGQTPGVAELLGAARERLPGYMIPSAVVLLDKLPLTPNGKLNRRALPAPAPPAGLGPPSEAPRTAVEEVVAGIWSEVLRVGQVGVHDNFFESGGHSLLASQVVARVRESFGTEVALRALFERPTVAGLAQSVEEALRAARPVQAPRLAPAPRGAESPLSFAQQRLWFLHQLEPEGAAYNLPTAVRLAGPLDARALARALNEVVRRHESLRTSFALADGQPVQRVAPAVTLSLPVVDLRGLAPDEREREARRVLRREAGRPFDLTRVPLLRAVLLRVGREEHVAVLVMHHIISDGWSMGVLTGELAALYEAFARGRSSPLPPLPVQYADYASWQRRWLQGEALQSQLAYWVEKLAPVPAALELPTDRPRPPVQSFRGARLTFGLPAALSAGLKELSRGEQATLYMTLLAAFKTLLHRYTHQRDIVVGTPIANRGDSRLEPLIGCFANTLCLRTELDGDLTFRQLLGRVRETALAAYAHQDVPFEKLVEELHPARDLSRTPLFQVMFTLLNAPRPTLDSASLRMSPLEVDHRTAKFDLELLMTDIGGRLVGALEYNTDLFEEGTIARLGEHFRALLAGAVADPSRRIGDLPLLGAAEERQCLVEWNDTAADYPLGRCLPQLFEEQAARTPEAVAATFGGEQLTYRELNRRANRLAHALAGQGVGPEVIVALLGHRDLDLLTAILAVFKAGGAYLPLDPYHPPARWRQVLRQSRARLVLAGGEFAAAAAEALAEPLGEETPRLLLTEQLFAGESPEHDPPARCRPGNLAYVIYTSGSTGVPKGAMVEHRGMLNHLFAKVTDLRLTGADCLAQTASQCFDISVWQFLAALLVGGRVRVYADEVAHDAARLLGEVAADGVTVFETVPALMRAALADADAAGATPPDLSALRWLVLTGEALPPELCRQVFDAYPRASLLNAYGPTECSDDVTHHHVEGPPAGHAARVPIGRAVANMRLYVLDPRGRPVPVGVSGELYVGGVGVGRGYLHDATRTAEVFVPDPFAEGPGARLYRTGDLARRLPGGAIDFLGRVDHQVKIRGFRIELGEVETVLLEHPSVEHAVVLAREDAPGERRLVAYVVGRAGQPAAAGALRGHLKERLPEYMIPQAFVTLEALPLTTNGKVDRRALPAPDGGRPQTERAFVAPRTPAEQQLADIWQKTLRLDQVGVHDNFFELGGDSILMIQIISRARQVGIQITLRDAFQHQTVAELAALEAAPRAVEAEQGAVTGRTPLTPAQHWLLEQETADPHHFNQSIMCEVREPMSPADLRRVVARLLAHHDALRLRVRRGAGGWEQFVAPPDGAAPFSLFDLTALGESEQRGAMHEAAAALQTSLNLFAGPLLRVALFDLGPDRPGRLLIIIHHLAVDGVSWRILLEDLQAAYGQLRRGEPALLPPKTTSFKYWAERLSEYAGAAKLRQEADYWLGGARRAAWRLPVDGGGPNTVGSARVVTVSLSHDETRQLLQVVPAASRAQINDLLLTALAQSFAPWTGSRRLLIDLEGHGREEIFEDVDVSRTVGWFTAIFPVLLDLDETADAGAALRAVMGQLREVPGRGLGYGLLRYLGRDAGVADRLRAMPQPEVIFNYLGQFDTADADAPSALRLLGEGGGATQSPRQTRRYLLEVGGSVAGGQLHLSFKYSRNVHRPATVERLAAGLLQALRALIEHYRSAPAGPAEAAAAPEPPAPDVPDIKLSRQTIEKALAEIDLG